MVGSSTPRPTPGTLPPGPWLAPLQTGLYMRDPHGYTRRLRERYGDTVTMPSMNGLVVLSMTSDGAREILRHPTDHFGEFFGSDALRPVLGGESLFLLTGGRHRAERKLLSPTFHGNRMISLAPRMLEATLERSRSWQDGQRTTLLEEMQAISLEVIIGAVLGIEDPERRARFRAAITHAVNEASPVLFFFRGMQHRFGGFGPWAKFLRHRDALRALLAEEIASARSRTAEGRQDILARLAQARRTDGTAFFDETIRDHLVTLLVAGHETTSSALSWTFYELTRNPDVCRWLLGELEALGADPAPETLSTNAALQATAREGLRLHPIIAEVFRPLLKPTRFQDFNIPAGAVLAASILEIHQDPSLYHEPEAFRPERFLERRFAPHEFLAFGGGHRYCLGAAFALSEMAVVIGTLLPRFRFELESDTPLRVGRRNVTLPPEAGAPVTLRVR